MEESMSRTRVVTTPFAVALTAAFAITWLAAPASAGKPEAVVSTWFAPNGDCSVDFEIDLNSRGQMPSVVVVHYWQHGTRNGANYQDLRSIERGGTLSGAVDFSPPAEPLLGAIYELGYTAFAKNGRIVGQQAIGTVDAAACL
jgi:hypothetical protein